MSSEEKRVTLDIASVRLDGGTQVRVRLRKAVVQDYAERMAARDVFPPIVVVYDGRDYWLADGFHRLHAALAREQTTIECRVFEGTLRDARLVALRANCEHGLRRTNADKRRAVAIALADEEWSKKSNRWIAQVCGVSHHLVESIRRGVGAVPTHPQVATAGGPVRIGRDGRPYAVRRRTAPPGTRHAAHAVAGALQAAELFDACLARLKKLRTEGQRLADGPGGLYLSGRRLDEFLLKLHEAGDLLSAARPTAPCELCHGTGCERCCHSGWVCPAKPPTA
ncbi:MAG TPA: ParB/RepB/Spo0J family partition protein [Pirellulales bacterium]|nr:ParB/RepB/Spo0J family partition protein [Pirellulales bacterium]